MEWAMTKLCYREAACDPLLRVSTFSTILISETHFEPRRSEESRQVHPASMGGDAGRGGDGLAIGRRSRRRNSLAGGSTGFSLVSVMIIDPCSNVVYGYDIWTYLLEDELFLPGWRLGRRGKRMGGKRKKPRER